MDKFLPCMKDKCLKYPICKQRREINCNDLSYFFSVDTVKSSLEVAKFLPNVKIIRRTTPGSKIYSHSILVMPHEAYVQRHKV